MRPEGRALRWLLFLAAMSLTLAAPASARVRQQTAPAPELFYHIFVRSFADSNGDRQGDLNGIRQKLDYLQDLGVTTIMLTPLYPSQFYHNYFADDFEGIDPEFGTMNDFSQLVSAAHARGMKVILDQEIQFVTGNHRWRLESRENSKSPYGRFLLYRDEANRTPAATLLGTNEFYVWPGQHQQIYTVNLAEPQVRAYFARYLKSWVDPNGDGDPSDGIDGFRIDHMMDDLDNVGLLTNLLSDFWEPLIEEVRSVKPDVRFIAEQADWGDGAAFFTKAEVDMVFAFPIREAAAELDAAKFAAAIERANAAVAPGRSQLVFIENHDTSRFAHGAARRPEILRLGAAITMLTGWVPSLYYGQEIGMSGTRSDEAIAVQGQPANADARDIGLRQAFRWQPDPMAPGNAAWYRAIPEAYRTPDSNVPGDGASVAEQSSNPGSLLNTYRELAALRARFPMLADGATKVVAQHDSAVLIERRSSRGTALVLFNLGAKEGTARLDLGMALVRRYGKARLVQSNGRRVIVAPAYSATVWTIAR